MFAEQGTRDQACFTCGHVIYEVDPLTLPPRLTQRIAHGGNSLA
jgi:hypothetical protein